jgi:hypothetical protein
MTIKNECGMGIERVERMQPLNGVYWDVDVEEEGLSRRQAARDFSV